MNEMNGLQRLLMLISVVKIKDFFANVLSEEEKIFMETCDAIHVKIICGPKNTLALTWVPKSTSGNRRENNPRVGCFFSEIEGFLFSEIFIFSLELIIPDEDSSDLREDITLIQQASMLAVPACKKFLNIKKEEIPKK